jgi:hypothetical protein
MTERNTNVSIREEDSGLNHLKQRTNPELSGAVEVTLDGPYGLRNLAFLAFFRPVPFWDLLPD